MRERLRILHTPTKGDTIAVFSIDGELRNVTVTDAALYTAVASTPETIPNPAFVEIAEKIFALAEKALDNPPKPIPSQE